MKLFVFNTGRWYSEAQQPIVSFYDSDTGTAIIRDLARNIEGRCVIEPGLMRRDLQAALMHAYDYGAYFSLSEAESLLVRQFSTEAEALTEMHRLDTDERCAQTRSLLDRGHFASAMAEAWTRADSSNKRKLEQSFREFWPCF